MSQPTVSPMDSTILTSVTQPSSSGTDGIDTLLALCMEDYGSVTDFSQLQAGLGVDVTEGWLPTADLLKGLPQLSGEDDGPQPPLRDIRSSVDIAPHPPSQGPHPPTLCQPAINNLVPEDNPTSRPSMKYPVLNAVMPFLGTDLPPQLVCHLLELYFIGPFPNILRKASFLTDKFRVTSPALLASMLWMAAIDHRAYLSISPSQQRNICQFLGDLTRILLQFSDNLSHKNQEPSLVEHIAHLDNVITCIHIASIISTEINAESMRWWKAAFGLARQLKLNQEAELTLSFDKQSNASPQLSKDGLSHWPNKPEFFHSDGTQSSLNCVCEQIHDQGYPVLTEEHREERRRAWWLLYIIDRHLALYHNRPPEFLDAECENMLLPLDETSWQSGIVHSNGFHPQSPHQKELQVFPDFRCRDSSIFGFFLPLMTITGEMMELNPLRLQDNKAYEVKEAEVLRHLEIYQTSLSAFMASTTSSTVDPKVSDQLVNGQLVQDHTWQTQTVVAYSSYLVQVLHISLVGKWDWQFLLEDKELWTSPAFTSTISHSLDAAFWLRQILQLDPNISFMPYFFGIQLLQGSFPVLLIVERLQDKCGEDILNAGEIMIQATESCLVTRNTDYQRKFRQLIRSAVSQFWGRPVSASEIRRRHKAVLDLWLWIRRGTNWSTDFNIHCET
ncbi:hypothetical protein N7449_009547 [Penicillium cf. viridicatum]|uniref:Xylanolytic transcriptional activator regulatory domain-containing protein n=1 Tax=Penicillium cf. viridicatum TaxID=2972119 RepID=A0A9W9M8P1_9EURO|nr:hypothetical protein N7449_009547 [Penicillium cf. viridicatum]